MLGEGIQQFQVFVVFAVLGLALGCIYLFGMGLFRSRLAIVIFDCIFGLFAIYAVFATNLATNNGQFRLFVLIALALGVTISVVTCKTLLDKASSALYNLFTTKGDEKDATRISQQKNIHTDSGGSSAGVASGMHVTDNIVADVVPKTKRSTSSSANRRAVRQASRAKQASRIHEDRRIRKALGAKQRTNGSRRHSMDSRKLQ